MAAPRVLTAFAELCAAAEARGLVVGLGLEGVGTRSRLCRVSVRKPGVGRQEVVGVRVGEKGLDHYAQACLVFLQRTSTR